MRDDYFSTFLICGVFVAVVDVKVPNSTPLTVERKSRNRSTPAAFSQGSFSNDNGDANENVTNFAYLVTKNNSFARSARAFSFLSISLPSSAKQQREMTKFEVLSRTSAFGDKFSFSPLN